jgi:hypothetical protein
VPVNVDILRQPLNDCLGEDASPKLIDALLQVMALDGEIGINNVASVHQKRERGRPRTSKWEQIAKQLWELEPIAFGFVQTGDLDRGDAEAIYRFRMACARELSRERFLSHINRPRLILSPRKRLVSIAAQVAEKLELFQLRPIATAGSTYVRVLAVVLRWCGVTSGAMSFARAGLQQHRQHMSAWGRRGPTKHDLSQRQIRQRQHAAAANAK